MTAPPDLIVQLEHAAFARDPDRSFPTLEALLQHLDGAMHDPKDGLFDDDSRATMQATRVAASICAMLSDPSLLLTADWYFRLVPFKRQLQAVFEVSGYESSAMPLRYMSDGVARVTTSEQEQSQLLKMLLVMGLRDCSPSMLETVRQLDPTVTAPLILGLVASKVALLPDAWEAREALLGLGDGLSGAQLSPRHLPLLAAAWMHCSYGIREDRHEFKAALNRWMARSLAEAGLGSNTDLATPALKERPRLVIVAEVLWQGHAMFRCYGDRIRRLKERFETILVARNVDLDDAASELVDRTATFPEGTAQVDQMAEHIRRLEPDLIYYPSVGMAAWAVALANLRLAPIQFMTPGHPATSATETMDYLFLTRNLVGEPASYSERVVICGEGQPRHVSYESIEVPEYRREEPGAPVNIAIPAYSMKLSWPLLDALRTIDREASRPIEWHFFPNESGLIRQHIRVVMERLFDRVRVYARAPYERYLAWLGQCQLSVGTFPFAGSNSNVDLLRIGIPRVVMQGRQSMERADVAALARFDGLSSLVTEDRDAFVKRTVTLVDNADERDQLSAQILSQDPTARLLGESESGAPFLEAVWFIYRHHGELTTDDCEPIDPFASRHAT